MNARICVKKHPDPAATAYRCSDCARELSGLGHKFRRPGLCAHLGELVRSVDCGSCEGRISLKVYTCPKRGEATLSRKLHGVAAVCDDCLHWTPAPATSPATAVAGCAETVKDSFSLISPVGTGKKIEGMAKVKPWEYSTTAIIPHLDTIDMLEVLIELLRLQTRRPYIIVVDTGSPRKSADRLEQLRSEDVEIHFIRGNGYAHTSEPVAVALDVGFARASTPYLFLTHTDCFPRRRDAIQWMQDQCSAEAPVVGWEMSERSWITDEWKGMVSHTFTMLHAPTMRRVGATWHMGRAREAMGRNAAYKCDGWPDTETGFAYCLRAGRIPVKLLGTEVNYQRQLTEWWDHARSFTGTQVYSKGTEQAQKTEAYTSDALADARQRVIEWRREHA